jgi:hypothetical protein
MWDNITDEWESTFTSLTGEQFLIATIIVAGMLGLLINIVVLL